MTSRLKIALLSAAVSGAVLAGFAWATLALVARQKLESVDTEIRSLGARHPGWIGSRGNYQRLDDALEFIFGSGHQDQIILLVKDVNGTVLHTSSGWPKELDPTTLDCRLETNPEPVTVGGGLGRGPGGAGRGLGPGAGGGQVTFTKQPRFLSARTADTEWRLGMLGTDQTTLVIGLNYAGPRAEINRLRNNFLLALPVALFLVGFGGWLVAGRALRPLTVIADTAERVTARGLDQRIPESRESPEAARVIHVLNHMMDRLEASFRQATRFSADASHEIKTPLAIMQGELENALQAAVPGSPEQQLFSNLLEETQRLKVITRSLLLLAQADAGQLKLARQPVELSTELKAMIEDARVLAADSRLTLETQIEPQPPVPADPALLRTALFNLIGNAIKYNHPDGKVSLRLQAMPDSVEFTIGNTGPGIPPADQPKIFERFYRTQRMERPRGDGIGLGLSLAREIIRAHGGELTLKESRPGWTEFVVTLPTHR
ncbi:MAG: HAMP domain-containing protein [Verrucomicrobiae bacterium]|nr:HAMP domain-containing protein [Verrucomicrobiae bacterium]